MELMMPTYTQLLILSVTGLTSVYFLFHILLSKFQGKEVARVLHPKNHKISVLIPARPEHSNVEESALRALMQSYSNDDFNVTVIADGLPGTTLLELQALDVNILPLDLEIKTNGYAIRETLKYLDPIDAEILVIVDPDHVLEFDFLEKVNQAFNLGARAVQGHRTPKKKTGLLNRLITANEEINHSVFRLGPSRVGISPTLIGTGMAFESQLLHDCAASIDGDQPLAKELDKQLHARNIKAWYLASAKVFMEKTSVSNLLRMSWSIPQAISKLATASNVGFGAIAHQIVRFFMPSKVVLWGANLGMAIYTQSDLFAFSTLLLTLVLLMGIPGNLYRVQLLEISLGLPQFLRLMFKYTGGESIARKNILFKNLPVEFEHEDRHRSTANL